MITLLVAVTMELAPLLVVWAFVRRERRRDVVLRRRHAAQGARMRTAWKVMLAGEETKP